MSKAKLLLLNANRDGWHSNSQMHMMSAISMACDTKIYGPGFPDYKSASVPRIIKQLYGNDRPDIIFSYFWEDDYLAQVYIDRYDIPKRLSFFPSDMNDVKGILKIFYISDFWQRDLRKVNRKVFDYCFSCFAPPYSNKSDFFRFLPFPDFGTDMKYVGIPRCVDTNCFKDYGQNKVFDVITLGSMHSFYPLRTLFHTFLEQKHLAYKIKYKNYPHCGHDFTHTDFVGEKYAMAINESKILLSCGGKYNLPFMKIFETMACNTVYMGAKPHGEEELHLKDGVNYVAVDKNNFVDKIRYYIQNPFELEEISKNGLETVNKYHSIEVRAKDFSEIIGRIL